MVQNSPAAGAWSTVEIAGHRTSVLEPEQPHPHDLALIYMHAAGCEDLADDEVFTAELASRGLRVVAPHTGESWWSDRPLSEFDSNRSVEQFVVHDVVAAIGERWGIDPPRIGLLGISMGGQAALRMAYKHPAKFPVAAAISPAIDFHLWLERPMPQPEITASLRRLYRDPEDARQDTATLHIHPLNWPRHQLFCTDPADHWHEGADRLQMKLASLGIPHEYDLTTAAGGHSWDYFHAMAPRVVEFVTTRLEQEHRRLPV